MTLKSYMPMIFTILGMVVLSAMLIPVMTALSSLYATPGAENFMLFQLVITIIPTILILGAAIALGFSYYKQYQNISSQDANGLMSLVIGIMGILLFIVMFGSVITNFSTLYTTYGSNSTWIAFGTVLTVVPTLMFLGGLFSGGLLVFGGGKKMYGRFKGRGGGGTEA